jgi:hypothetical protein
MGTSLCQWRKIAQGTGRFDAGLLYLCAFFFAILHLGVLMLGSGGLSALSGIYLVGLILALLR